MTKRKRRRGQTYTATPTDLRDLERTAAGPVVVKSLETGEQIRTEPAKKPVPAKRRRRRKT